MKSKTVVLVVASIIATGFLATNLSISAFAQGALPQSGFGKASKDFATSEPGALGEHSSSFAGQQRQGIGNVPGISPGPDRGGAVGQLGCTLDRLQGFSGC